LIVAYHFPPDAAVGGMRPAKFAKYLSRDGWQPYILTVHERYFAETDWSRLDDVQNLPTIRTRCWPTLLQLALRIKRRLGVRSGGASRGFSFHVKRCANSLLELPDQQIGWLIPAVWTGRRLIRENAIRTVIVSSPPRTAAVIGLLLSYLAPIRLITDLRDPWFTPYLQPDSAFRSIGDIAAQRSAFGDAIERWLEKKIIERSSKIIVTTDRLAEVLREAYPAAAGCIVVITNGYDAEDLPVVDPPEPGRRFTLSYLGSLLLDRTPEPFFEALAQLVRERRLSPSEIRVNVIGHVRSTLNGNIDTLITANGLKECVHVADPATYADSLREMFQSDALLLLTPTQSCSVPSKTFEYLAARKAILCLAPESASADLITQTGAGIVAAPGDVEAIKLALMTLVEAFRRGEPVSGCADASAYERKALSKQLADHLAQLG
jgi:glycosyltransferase involved in cell wall biosynthesis